VVETESPTVVRRAGLNCSNPRHMWEAFTPDHTRRGPAITRGADQYGTVV